MPVIVISDSEPDPEDEEGLDDDDDDDKTLAPPATQPRLFSPVPAANAARPSRRRGQFDVEALARDSRQAQREERAENLI